MSIPHPSDDEPLSAQFSRLVRDLINGTLRRSRFHRWEIELLLDISQCDLPESRRCEILRDYQFVVRRYLRNGGDTPTTLSQYLAAKRLEV